MSARRTRAIVAVASRPKLRRHARLQYDPVRQAWALLSPEKIFWPDETSLAILKLCDGESTVEEISGRLAAEFDADAEAIRADVLAFAQEWSDRMVLQS
jgi:pyrroloquinoline quinone biosynthesis protein D